MRCITLQKHFTSLGEANHTDAGQTSHTVEGLGPRSLGSCAKVTLPTPSILHFFGGVDAVSKSAYPDIEQFAADLAAIYRKQIAGLAALDQMGHACPVPRVESAGLVAGRLVLRAEADGPELIVRPLRAGGEPVAVASETDVRRVLALPRPVPAGDQSPLVPQSL